MDTKPLAVPKLHLWRKPLHLTGAYSSVLHTSKHNVHKALQRFSVYPPEVYGQHTTSSAHPLTAVCRCWGMPAFARDPQHNRHKLNLTSGTTSANREGHRNGRTLAGLETKQNPFWGVYKQRTLPQSTLLMEPGKDVGMQDVSRRMQTHQAFRLTDTPPLPQSISLVAPCCGGLQESHEQQTSMLTDTTWPAPLCQAEDVSTRGHSIHFTR